MNLILSILGLFISSVVFANQTETTKALDDSPVETIQSVIVKLNQLSKAQHLPKAANILLEREITPLFDFNYIANEVLWVLNTDFSQAEVQSFANKLKDNIVAILLSKLSQINSTSLSFVSARPIMNNNILVKLRVNNYYAFGFYIDLLFHQNDNKKWQIFDIVLNNDSLINYYQKVVLIQARRYGIYKILEKFN